MADPDFGAPPETVAEDGFVITDGGMQRETADELRHTLTNDAPAPTADDPDADAPPAPDDASDRDVEAQGADPVGAPKPTPPAPVKGKRTVEGRVAELQREIGLRTREKHDTIRERDAAKAELDAIRADLARLQQARDTGKPVDRVEAPAKANAPQGTIPKKPVWTEYDEAGKGWDDYLGDLDTYLEARIDASTGAVKAQFEAQLQKTREDADRAAATVETRAAQAAVDAAHRARVKMVADAHPDFEDVVKNLAEVETTDFMRDVIQMHPQGAQLLYDLGHNADAAAILCSLDFTQTMFDVVMESDNPSALLLHLASDSDTFNEIRQMPSAVANRRLAALDTRLSSTSTPVPRASGSRGPGTSVSRAAAPIRPVGGTSKAPVSESDDESDDESMEAFLARENERDAKRARY